MPISFFFFLFFFFSLLICSGKLSACPSRYLKYLLHHTRPYLLSPDFVSQLSYLPTLHAVSFCFIVSREIERAGGGGREEKNRIPKSRSSLNFLSINHSRVVPDFRTLSLQCTRKDSDP